MVKNRKAELDPSDLTTCMPCSFGLLPHPRSGSRRQRNRHLRVTVIDRYVPLVTAAYGTRVARPARTTTLPRDSDGSSSGRRVRPVPGAHCIVGKSPQGSRQPGEETGADRPAGHGKTDTGTSRGQADYVTVTSGLGGGPLQHTKTT